MVLVVRASFCGREEGEGGGFGVYWVSEVADLGLLPLLVGMGDPWISGLPCVGWCSSHWSGVRTLYVMHSGAPLCLAFVGFLPLAMVEAGGQMEASGAGDPFVY